MYIYRAWCHQELAELHPSTVSSFCLSSLQPSHYKSSFLSKKTIRDQQVRFIICITLLCFVSVSNSQEDASASSFRHSCLPDQKSALLGFKQESQPLDCSGYRRSFPKMNSWNDTIDCSSWDGVTCDAESVIVIGLNMSFSCLHGSLEPLSSLFKLTHLQRLDLSRNVFETAIPAEIARLQMLTHLNLSNNFFSGRVPPQLAQLSRLVSLDLSLDYRLSIRTHTLRFRGRDFKAFIQNATSLKELHLEQVKLSPKAHEFLVNLSSFSSLNLAYCGLVGKFPESILELSTLRSLRLSGNHDLTGSLPEFHHNSSLALLDLSYTNFSSVLPDSIGNLKSLSYMDLTACSFWGKIPPSLGSLSQLSYLRFKFNYFNGTIPSSIGNLSKLNFLDFAYNRLVGEMPSSLGNLTNLEYLKLSRNHLQGQIPASLWSLQKLVGLALDINELNGTLQNMFQNLTRLSQLYLSDNFLSGHLPPSINNLSSLSVLDMSNNSFSGSSPLLVLTIPSLEFLSLSYNLLSGCLDFDNTSTKLWLLNLRGNDFEGQLPRFLYTLTNLTKLYLSDNKFEGQVRSSLWGMQRLQVIDLSYNLLSGFKGTQPLVLGREISFVDLSSNMFQGLFPALPLSTEFLFASENNFSGEIPQSICALTSLRILVLSNNHFAGSVPECLGSLSSSLEVLDLRSNNLHGEIPQTFNSRCSLKTMDLSRNQLAGRFPRSLVNCEQLQVVNLENNHINDVFPSWLEGLPELLVLVLRYNKFHGPIWLPLISSGFPNLRVIDISHNGSTGSIPSTYFANWTQMAIPSDEHLPRKKYIGDLFGYYKVSVVVTSKGYDMNMDWILTIFSAIDLSYNRFEGEIPGSLGEMRGLRDLNLSGNSFTGHIPPSLAHLINLESFDLSQNKLSGRISPVLGSLTFLAFMNFSYNRLTGLIPQATQFQTQPTSSFEGNPGLYGCPLSECGGTHSTSQQNPDTTTQPDAESEPVNWIAAAIGYVPGLMLGVTIGHIITSCRNNWFEKIISPNKRRRTRTRR